MRTITRRLLPLLALLALPATGTAAAAAPAVGQTAPEATLATPAGAPVSVGQLAAQGPLVVLVLRGYPGYQCPLCTQQVGEFLSKAEAFRKAGARVLLVYPGPAERAREFLAGRELPAPFTLAVDPDMRLVGAWGLRWNAPRETAYPATFVLDRTRTVRWALVSKSHGGRSRAADVLKALEGLR